MIPESAPVEALSAAEKRALLAKMLRERTTRAKESFHPLSYMQRTLWAHYQLVPESAAYSIPIVTRLRNRLDAAALNRAVQALTVRHAMLRTTYTVRDGRPVQHVHAEMAATFELHDVTGLHEDALVRRMEAEIQLPFDLEKGPMLRVSVYTKSATEHVVLLAVHHIAIDFWSLEILIDELPALYAAELTGQRAVLADLPCEYTDFVACQRELIAGPEGERLWSYWQKALAGTLPLPDLPTDHARPALQEYRGYTHFFKLDDDLARRLTALSRAEGATLYVTLLTVFHVLLQRYSGRKEMVVGAPTAGRNRPGFENIVGCFSEGVMLKTDLSGEPTFRELLDRVRRKVSEALLHQDLPAALLVEKLGLPWDPSRSPMSQVMFGWDKPLRLATRGRAREDQRDPERDGWLDFESVLKDTFALAHRTTMFDLLMIGIDLGPSLYVLMQGNVSIFRPDTVVRMAGHFQTLLEAVTRNPDTRVRDLPLLVDAETRAMESWNATAAEFPATCVHRMFEARVETSPDAVALEHAGAAVTYRELNQRANRLANGLRSLGVGPEVTVAIFLDRSPEMIVSALATMKAGGAYVPLDPANPSDRLASVLDDSRPAVVLTVRALAGRLPPDAKASPRELVLLDEQPFRFESEDTGNLAGDPGLENLAYVMYTSGTTGRPKGVAIQHRGLANFVHWQCDELEFGPGVRVLQFASFGFDVSVGEIFCTLASGATLCLARRDDLLPGQPLADLLVRERITLVTLPPAVLAILPEGEYFDLKTVASGGDACSPRVVQRWADRGAGTRRLLNVYGPTEATIWATFAELAASDRLPPIGRPMSNVGIRILDANHQLQPVGVPGELYITGVGLARGYVNDPRSTAAKFLPDPLGVPGTRMYHSGDHARYLTDGTIECLGRVDHQIKLRGYRIEPGEIESVLRRVPGVREAVVVASAEGATEKRLVAYIVPSGARPPEVATLRQALKRSLPAYMAPGAFVMLEALPRTSLGKLDREALPPPRREGAQAREVTRTRFTIHGREVDPSEIEALLNLHGSVRECAVVACDDGAGDERLFAYIVPRNERAPMSSELRASLAEKLPDYKIPASFVLIDELPLSDAGVITLDALPLPEWAVGAARSRSKVNAQSPRGEIEARLTTIFAHVLDVEKVELSDSFFDLGGYSFLAAELIYRVRQEFGVQLVLSSLFEAPTVASLARVVASGRDDSANPLVVMGGAAAPSGDLREGAAPPLFCLHAAGGQVLVYRHLASALGEERALYGIQSRALAGAADEHATIESMAAHYADVIRRRQPDGPYHLLGHSMGGVVAIAVADVLERDGREVAFVGLLDSYLLPDDGKLPAFGALDFMPDLVADGANPALSSMSAMFADMDPGAQEHMMQNLLASDSDEMLDGMFSMLESMKIPLPMSRGALVEQLRMFQAHVRMLAGYRPPVVRAPLNVWWAGDNPQGASVPRSNWRPHTTARVTEDTVGGNHYTMLLPPRVEALAAKIRRASIAAHEDE